MLRLLRRIAKGEVVTVPPAARRGVARTLADLFARGLLAPHLGAEGIQLCRLTVAGRAELHAARTVSPV